MHAHDQIAPPSQASNQQCIPLQCTHFKGKQLNSVVLLAWGPKGRQIILSNHITHVAFVAVWCRLLRFEGNVNMLRRSTPHPPMGISKTSYCSQ